MHRRMDIVTNGALSARVPPEDGHADVSFWYATCVYPISFRLCTLNADCFGESRYLVVGVGLLLVSEVLTTTHSR